MLQAHTYTPENARVKSHIPMIYTQDSHPKGLSSTLSVQDTFVQVLIFITVQ